MILTVAVVMMMIMVKMMIITLIIGISRYEQSSAHLETKTLFLSSPLPELTQLMPNMVTATLASL